MATRAPWSSPRSIARELAIAGWETALELAREKGPAPIMDEDFTVSAEMLRKRPEMRTDGWKVGATIKGRDLHIRYSRYMQRSRRSGACIGRRSGRERCPFHSSLLYRANRHHLTVAGEQCQQRHRAELCPSLLSNVIREGRKTKDKVEVCSFELLAYRALVNAEAMPYAEQEEQRLPKYFVTADEVTPKQHVDIQAAAQKWIDSSISKTANVPTEYPFEDFKDIYAYAWEQGLKGCTTFRFNPEAFQGVLVKEDDLANTTYRFELEDGSVVEAKGNEEMNTTGRPTLPQTCLMPSRKGTTGNFRFGNNAHKDRQDDRQLRDCQG